MSQKLISSKLRRTLVSYLTWERMTAPNTDAELLAAVADMSVRTLRYSRGMGPTLTAEFFRGCERLLRTFGYTVTEPKE